MTSKQQHQLLLQKATRKGGATQTVLMEHYTQQQGGGSATSTSQSLLSAQAAAVIVGHQSSTSSPAMTDAAGMINTLRPAKTKLGKARIRMKWTTEVNEYILRTYYTITQLETNCKHYRDTLHRHFSDEFPDVEVCAQRIADQRRAIVKNHLLTQERIDEIRREVEVELQGGGSHPQQQQQPHPLSIASTVSSSVGGGTPIIFSSAKGEHGHHPASTMTVWYGCVKEEEEREPPQDTDGYHVAGPSSHKLRKLNQGDSVSGGGGGGGQQHHQPHILIHTTASAAAAAAAAMALKR